MISLLKGRGFKFTQKETLNNREFREGSKTFAKNEDESPFEKRAYDLTEAFELFLDTKHYRTSLIESIFEDTRDEPVDDITIDVDRQERGYLITITTIKIGVK